MFNPGHKKSGFIRLTSKSVFVYMCVCVCAWYLLAGSTDSDAVLPQSQRRLANAAEHFIVQNYANAGALSVPLSHNPIGRLTGTIR